MSEEREKREAFLRAYLAEFDEACPVCGYSLLGLEGGRCPECGERLSLCVHRDGWEMYSWGIGLIPLAGVMFWSSLSLIMRAVVLDKFSWAQFGVMICFGLGAMAWVRWRRAFIQLKPGLRGLLAGGLWILAFIAGLVVMYFTRP